MQAQQLPLSCQRTACQQLDAWAATAATIQAGDLQLACEFEEPPTQKVQVSPTLDAVAVYEGGDLSLSLLPVAGRQLHLAPPQQPLPGRQLDLEAQLCPLVLGARASHVDAFAFDPSGEYLVLAIRVYGEHNEQAAWRVCTYRGGLLAGFFTTQMLDGFIGRARLCVAAGASTIFVMLHGAVRSHAQHIIVGSAQGGLAAVLNAPAAGWERSWECRRDGSCLLAAAQAGHLLYTCTADAGMQTISLERPPADGLSSAVGSWDELAVALAVQAWGHAWGHEPG